MGKKKLEAETKRFAPAHGLKSAKRSVSIDSFGVKGTLELERKSFIFQFLTTGKIIRKSTFPTPDQTFPLRTRRRMFDYSNTHAPASRWMAKKSLDTVGNSPQ